jgi:hypothetical protein
MGAISGAPFYFKRELRSSATSFLLLCKIICGMKTAAKVTVEVIESVVTAAFCGATTYWIRGYPGWIGMAVLGFGFSAYRNGLLKRIGLKEDKDLS